MSPMPPQIDSTSTPPSSDEYSPVSSSIAYEHQLRLADQREQIRRTKAGLLMLTIGLILNPLPWLGTLGAIIELIGAILIVLGRRAFGEKHSKYTFIGLIILFTGIVTIASLFLSLFIIVINISFAANSRPEEIHGLVRWGLWMILVASSVFGISTVLFIYNLQKSVGRVMLLIGYISSIIISITIGFILDPVVIQAGRNSIPSSIALRNYDPGPLEILPEQLLFTLLQLIPAVIYAAASLAAWRRIKNAEIPSPIATLQ